MSIQGNQGEVDPLVGVGHEIPRADDGAQVGQLTQAQSVQIVSNAVSQARVDPRHATDRKQPTISYCSKSRDAKHNCCTTVSNTHQAG